MTRRKRVEALVLLQFHALACEAELFSLLLCSRQRRKKEKKMKKRRESRRKKRRDQADGGEPRESQAQAKVVTARELKETKVKKKNGQEYFLLEKNGFNWKW
ncbi:hypothetical protein V8C26DRAFT_389987 [Trichoderma gracile]